MSDSTLVVWDDVFTDYDFGPSHPMRPMRLELTMALAGQLGVPAVQVGQAALLGQMTTGFPVSPPTPATFLVVGLCGIELAEHQKFTFPLLFGASIVMTIACVVLGVF